MVKLFNSLDYEVKTTPQHGMVYLEATFDKEVEKEE